MKTFYPAVEDWMVGCDMNMLNSQEMGESLEPIRFKLTSFFRGDYPWNFEATDPRSISVQATVVAVMSFIGAASGHQYGTEEVVPRY